MAENLAEHVYIIPLRDARRMPRWKRANGAIKDIRKYLAKHMKSEDVAGSGRTCTGIVDGTHDHV